jgi:hypothetical protein
MSPLVVGGVLSGPITDVVRLSASGVYLDLAELIPSPRRRTNLPPSLGREAINQSAGASGQESAMKLI